MSLKRLVCCARTCPSRPSRRVVGSAQVKRINLAGQCMATRRDKVKCNAVLDFSEDQVSATILSDMTLLNHRRYLSGASISSIGPGTGSKISRAFHLSSIPSFHTSESDKKQHIMCRSSRHTSDPIPPQQAGIPAVCGAWTESQSTVMNFSMDKPSRIGVCPVVKKGFNGRKNLLQQLKHPWMSVSDARRIFGLLRILPMGGLMFGIAGVRLWSNSNTGVVDTRYCSAG